MKRFKRLILMFVTLAMVASVVCPVAVSALSVAEIPETYYDAKKTSLQKMYYNMLHACISNYSNFRWSFANLIEIFIKNEHAKAGQIFAYDAWNSGTGKIGVGVGVAYAEKLLTGAKNDGKIWCGEGGNHDALLTHAAEAWGVDKWDIMCDYRTANHDGPGIIKMARGSGSACMDGNGDYEHADGRIQYLKDLVTDKAFGGQPPGGSISEFTDAEKYWFYYNTFTEICTTGAPRVEEDGPDYTIGAVGENGVITKVGYIADADWGKNKGVVTSTSGQTTTCQKMADYIKPDSAYTLTAQALEQAFILRDCINKNTALLDSIKSEIDKKRELYNLYTNNGNANPVTDADGNEFYEYRDPSSGDIARQPKADVDALKTEADLLENGNPEQNNGYAYLKEQTDRQLNPSADINSVTYPFSISSEDGSMTCHVDGYTDPEREPPEEPDDDETTCNGEAFGWFLCPIATAGQGVFGMFNDMVSTGLTFDLLTSNDEASQAVKNGWNAAVALANIAFAIVFLVIIYSTATSTGLKNYDIKKIMPRLVIAAILVNTSFWICAGISDLINILGTNIYGFIAGFAQTLGQPTDQSFAQLLVGTLIVLVVVVLNIGTALLALLLIIVLMQFRTIAIVALIIISPLAFVAWLLPNTEKWFKKWLTEFVRLLFVYPMFMAVWGLTRFATAVTQASSQNLITWIGEIILLVVPALALIPIFKMGGSLMGKFQGLAEKAQKSKFAQEKFAGNLNNMSRYGARRLQNRIGQGKMQKDGTRAGLDNSNKVSRFIRRRVGGGGIFGERGIFNAELNKARLEGEKKSGLAAQREEKLKAAIEGKVKLSTAENQAEISKLQSEIDRALKLHPATVEADVAKIAAMQGRTGSEYQAKLKALETAMTTPEYANNANLMAYLQQQHDNSQKELESQSVAGIYNGVKIGGRNLENGDTLKLFQQGFLDTDTGRLDLASLDRYQVRGLARHLLDDGGSGEKQYMSEFMDNYQQNIMDLTGGAGYVDLNGDMGLLQNDASSLTSNAAKANYAISGSTTPRVSRGAGILTRQAQNIDLDEATVRNYVKRDADGGETQAAYDTRISNIMSGGTVSTNDRMLLQAAKTGMAYSAANISQGNTADMLGASDKKLRADLASMTEIQNAIVNNDYESLGAMLNQTIAPTSGNVELMQRFRDTNYAKQLDSAVSSWDATKTAQMSGVNGQGILAAMQQLTGKRFK